MAVVLLEVRAGGTAVVPPSWPAASVVTLTTQPSYGYVTFPPDGSARYQARPGFEFIDRFVLRAVPPTGSPVEIDARALVATDPFDDGAGFDDDGGFDALRPAALPPPPPPPVTVPPTVPPTSPPTSPPVSPPPPPPVVVPPPVGGVLYPTPPWRTLDEPAEDRAIEHSDEGRMRWTTPIDPTERKDFRYLMAAEMGASGDGITNYTLTLSPTAVAGGLVAMPDVLDGSSLRFWFEIDPLSRDDPDFDEGLPLPMTLDLRTVGGRRYRKVLELLVRRAR